MAPVFWGRKPRSYQVELWPGRHLLLAKVMSSCGPVASAPERGPLSSPGAQQLWQHLPRVGHAQSSQILRGLILAAKLLHTPPHFLRCDPCMLGNAEGLGVSISLTLRGIC